MAGIGTGSGAVFIPELWIPVVQKATENNLVAAKCFFNVSGYGEVKSKGDVIHVPKLSNYTASDKVADTELPASAITETEFTLTVNKHKGIRIPVEDIAKVQASYELTQLFSEKIGFGLAKALDSELLALFSGLSQTVGATAATDGGISDTNIVRALRFLDGADAPQDGRGIIIDQYGVEDMRLIDKFTRYDSIAQVGASRVTEGLTGGKLQGSIYGLPVYVTTNLQTTSVVGGTLARGLVFHREAFAYATQLVKRMETWRNAPQLRDEIIGQTLYGVAEYRDNHGVVLSYPQA